MTPLEQVIRDKIKAGGPMRIDTFMELALRHPEYGYYRTRDPLGQAGDFTTAPEISQMFGELLGAWVVDVWQKLGSPARFQFVEIGPGRGTLMADALRVTKNVSGFAQAARVVLIEVNPALIALQREMLADYEVSWFGALDQLPAGVEPVILLANEFLDVLPVRQFSLQGVERMVILRDEKLAFSFDRDIREESPAQHQFIRQTASLINKRKGAALIIDYGYEGPAVGDTLQAIKKHHYIPVLSDIGEADITAHVDFAALGRAAADVQVAGPVEQGKFLQELGIAPRVQKLQKSNPSQAADLDKAYTWLIGQEKMGQLFKVMALHHGLLAPPEGFDVYRG